jgi:hypothetical protein
MHEVHKTSNQLVALLPSKAQPASFFWPPPVLLRRQAAALRFWTCARCRSVSFASRSTR